MCSASIQPASCTCCVANAIGTLGRAHPARGPASPCGFASRNSPATARQNVQGQITLPAPSPRWPASQPASSINPASLLCLDNLSFLPGCWQVPLVHLFPQALLCPSSRQMNQRQATWFYPESFCEADKVVPSWWVWDFLPVNWGKGRRAEPEHLSSLL